MPECCVCRIGLFCLEGVLGRLFGGSHPVVYAWGRSMRWCASDVLSFPLCGLGRSVIHQRRSAIGLILVCVRWCSFRSLAPDWEVPCLCTVGCAHFCQHAPFAWQAWVRHMPGTFGVRHTVSSGAPGGVTKHIGTELSAGAPYSEHHSNTSLQRRLGRQTLADCPESTYFPGAE